MATKKAADPEEEYFARLEAERRAELKKKLAEKEQAAAGEQRRQQHWMKCPKCGSDLTPEVSRGIEIDRCASCGGMWLDAGELDALANAPKSGGFFRRLLGAR